MKKSSSDNDAARADHLIQSIDKLLESGQLTADEAATLRAHVTEGRQDQAVRVIRAKHAASALAEAVSEGSLTQQEADSYLQRLRDGDHSPALRADLRELRRQVRQSGSNAPSVAAPGTDKGAGHDAIGSKRPSGRRGSR